MDIISIFSQNLIKHRKKRNLSQEKLAAISGLHRTYISSIERKKRNISLINIEKIASALEIEIYELFIEEECKNDKI